MQYYVRSLAVRTEGRTLIERSAPRLMPVMIETGQTRRRVTDVMSIVNLHQHYHHHHHHQKQQQQQRHWSPLFNKFFFFRSAVDLAFQWDTNHGTHNAEPGISGRHFQHTDSLWWMVDWWNQCRWGHTVSRVNHRDCASFMGILYIVFVKWELGTVEEGYAKPEEFFLIVSSLFLLTYSLVSSFSLTRSWIRF